MNKFEFIKDLLETKKFNSNQKDRFIRLVSSEFANLEAKDSKILADIKAIKEKIGLLDVSAIISGEEKAENEKYGIINWVFHKDLSFYRLIQLTI